MLYKVGVCVQSGHAAIESTLVPVSDKLEEVKYNKSNILIDLRKYITKNTFFVRLHAYIHTIVFECFSLGWYCSIEAPSLLCCSPDIKLENQHCASSLPSSTILPEIVMCCAHV